MYIKKQDNKGQHLEDGRDAFQKQEVSSHQVPRGNADSLCLSPPAWNPSVLLCIYLFSSWMLDINFPKSCHNMSSRGIPQLQQNDPVSMKWMDKEIKHRDFSQCFFAGAWVRSAPRIQISIRLPPQEKCVAAGEGCVCLLHTSKFSPRVDNFARFFLALLIQRICLWGSVSGKPTEQK